MLRLCIIVYVNMFIIYKQTDLLYNILLSSLCTYLNIFYVYSRYYHTHYPDTFFCCKKIKKKKQIFK